MTRQAKYRILGVNDDTDACSLCGRTGLKRVVWLEPVDPDGAEIGGPAAYGCCCAARLMGYTYTTPARMQARFTNEARAAEAERQADRSMLIRAMRRSHRDGSRANYLFWTAHRNAINPPTAAETFFMRRGNRKVRVWNRETRTAELLRSVGFK